MDSKKFLGLLIPRASFHLWIVLFLVIVIAVLDWRVAIPGFALFAFLIYYNIHTNYKRKVEISSFIENLNFNMDTATKDTLLNFPMPLVVTELDGSIIWYNSSFRDISEHEDVFEESVKSIVKELKNNELLPEKLKENPVSISKHIELNGLHYNVLCNLARRDGKADNGSYLLILYFIDVTELVELKKSSVTLSLGFGLNGSSPWENFRSATASIDLALGRGGDQVVVKNGENFSFFGGKTRELEKRTKVKARVIAFALRELIDQAGSVFIMGHENADIDSMGAALGVYRIVKSRGKNAYIVLNKNNPTIDSLMVKIQKSAEYENLFINRSDALEMVSRRTLLIIVDTHRRSFTEIPELIGNAGQVVVIDHHRRGADYIQETVLTYQETYASSTCELVTEVLQYIDERLKLNQVEAEALYAGIVVDTKNFTFKTGVRTFEAASYLRRQGVDTVAVRQLFQNDFETYTSISNVVKSAEWVTGEIALSSYPHAKNAQLIAAKAADELLNLSGIIAAFVLCTVGNEVWISGRSLGDINVQVILEKLGGGGHLTVAGAQLQGIGLEEAKEKLKYAIMEYIKEMNKPNT